MASPRRCSPAARQAVRRHRPRQRHQSHRTARTLRGGDPDCRTLGSRVIAVSAALKRVNGADRRRARSDRRAAQRGRPRAFRPVEREEARRGSGSAPRKSSLSVGNLVPEKGHDLFIEASRPARGSRRSSSATARAAPVPTSSSAHAASPTGSASREMPQEQLRLVYSAADALVLASTREGWPNVLLEAMACGTPVVATAVGGVREIIADPVAGRVVESRDDAFARSRGERPLASPPERSAVRRYAERFGWDRWSMRSSACSGPVDAAAAC